jgi:hypothetical protein
MSASDDTGPKAGTVEGGGGGISLPDWIWDLKSLATFGETVATRYNGNVILAITSVVGGWAVQELVRDPVTLAIAYLTWAWEALAEGMRTGFGTAYGALGANVGPALLMAVEVPQEAIKSAVMGLGLGAPIAGAVAVGLYGAVLGGIAYLALGYVAPSVSDYAQEVL